MDNLDYEVEPVPFIIRVLEASDIHRGNLEALPFFRRAREGHGAPEDYLRFLTQLYHVVWHFCPIMAAAATRCPDQFAGVRRHLYDAMQDEQGHELIVLEDLAALGGNRTLAVEGPVPLPVVALIGANYYNVERVHPCMVLGMLYVLEFIASAYAGSLADAYAEVFGTQPSAPGFRFLKLHGALDQHHVAQLHELMGTISDPLAQQRVIEATELNFHLFEEWVRGLDRESDAQRERVPDLTGLH